MYVFISIPLDDSDPVPPNINADTEPESLNSWVTVEKESPMKNDDTAASSVMSLSGFTAEERWQHRSPGWAVARGDVAIMPCDLRVQIRTNMQDIRAFLYHILLVGVACSARQNSWSWGRAEIVGGRRPGPVHLSNGRSAKGAAEGPRIASHYIVFVSRSQNLGLADAVRVSDHALLNRREVGKRYFNRHDHSKVCSTLAMVAKTSAPSKPAAGKLGAKAEAVALEPLPVILPSEPITRIIEHYIDLSVPILRPCKQRY